MTALSKECDIVCVVRLNLETVGVGCITYIGFESGNKIDNHQ